MAKPELIYVGIKGSVVALSATTGEMVWNTVLKGAEFVHLVLDGEVIYASTKGEVFCLDALTGRIHWNNPLKGYGLGLASIVTRNSVSSSMDLIAELKRREQQSQAAAASAAGAAG
jgi:outer membrane protein assembly factor BamB